MNFEGNYEIIIIGAGHAGCEAALAAARMNAKTALFTINKTKMSKFYRNFCSDCIATNFFCV